MYNYPDKKQNYYTIPTKYGTITYLLDQRTAEQSYDYGTLLNTNKTDMLGVFEGYLARRKYLRNILCKSEVKTSKRYYKPRIKKLVYLNLHLYEGQLLELCSPTWKSLYEDMPVASSGKNKRGVFSSANEILAEKTGIPVDEIDKRLTVEQKGRRLDKATYDYYESFKKGEDVNSMVRSKMPLDDSEKDFIEQVKREKALYSKTKLG